MSLTYTGDTGIFTNLGAVISQVNECQFDLEDWDDRLAAVQDSFELAEQQTALAPALSYVTQIQTGIVNARAALGNLCTLRLQDYDTVISPLGIATTDIGSVLYAMINQMVTDSASVDASTVTIDSVTPGGSNVGNGTVLVDGTLDGYSAPVIGGIAHPAYTGRLTELSVTETMLFRCTQDSYADGVTSGQETFSWSGQLALQSAWAYGTEGSGNGPSVRTLQSGTVISNGTMETFTTTNIPDSWTLAAGTVTTNLIQDAVNVYRGSSSVKLIGNSSAATIRIEQAVAASRVKPLRRYCCSIRYKASAAEGAGGKTFTAQFTGTGYTAGTTEKISIGGTSLATSWTLAYFFVTMPAVIPSDFALAIQFAGTPTVSISVDDVGLEAVAWHNGICAAIVAGSTPFVKGDTFTVAVANDGAGTFQEYARRQWKIQWPSNSSSAETISDALAEI